MERRECRDATVTLYWLPVGAGTHFQRSSLRVYAAFEALVARRRPVEFLHAGLKLAIDGRRYTLELTPVPRRQPVAPLVSGAVGSAWAGRLRLFRYQLICLESERLPDEEYVVGEPIELAEDGGFAERVLARARIVPAHTWGRRVAGTTEMWTSDSAVSWLVTKAGIAAGDIAVPKGYRAPGCRAGACPAGQAAVAPVAWIVGDRVPLADSSAGRCEGAGPVVPSNFRGVPFRGESIRGKAGDTHCRKSSSGITSRSRPR
ncbi:MAG: hypothetical protein ACM3S1_05290 [Hyphomicrobiales bacterium]